MNKFGRRTTTAAVAIGVAATGALVAPSLAGAATADSPGVARVGTRGLDGPFGLASRGSGFVVAENESGQVTGVGPYGGKQVLVSGAPGVAGVAAGGGRVYSVLGGPNESGQAPAGRYGVSRVLRTNPTTGRTVVIANLLRYERRHNPDHQVQLVHGHPVDSLSNPFAMTKYPRGLLVADGGANDVLRVNPSTGRVSTFFAPPTVKDVAFCRTPDAQANPGTVGCDPVPTGVTYALGSVYVSTLGAEVPGAGRVYKLNARSGQVQRVWKGLTAPTGIAVTRTGAIFVSEVLYGAPPLDGPPPAGFDPSTVGRITRIGPGGRVTHAQVTMPTGLLLKGDRLFASAWSVASFVGLQHAGQIVRVRTGSFH